MKVALHFPHIAGNDCVMQRLWQKTLAAPGIEAASPEQADVLVMWGIPERNRAMFDFMRRRQKPVLVLDYPFWNRPGQMRGGPEFYKISLNGHHPLPWLMRETHSPARFHATGGPAIHDWRAGGRHIVVIGMGKKSEVYYRYASGQWDQQAVDTIRRHTQMPVFYWRKPNNRAIRSIRGAAMIPSGKPPHLLIAGAHALVAHHSHFATVALSVGVPVFVHDGAALPLAETDLSKIMAPRRPSNRAQFFANLAHWQWSADEIAAGTPLASLRERGLI